MARIKNKPELGVADGFDFSVDSSIEETNTLKPPADTNKSVQIKNIPDSAGRTYSKYYIPKPKVGKKGGVIGHPPVNENDRKIQFSISCTKDQKQRYQDAAKADGRKLPDFINHAIQEYIDRHNL